MPFFFLEEIDMTEEHSLLTGSVPKKLAAFAFPLLLANILQSFYNVVDMLVVGQIVGDTGLAAIGNASKLCLYHQFNLYWYDDGRSRVDCSI